MAHRGYELYHRPSEVERGIIFSNRSQNNFVTVGGDGSFGSNFDTIEEAIKALGCVTDLSKESTRRANAIISTILIFPGIYDLPKHLGDDAINFVGAGFGGRPSVIVTGITESCGNKHWDGIRFTDVTYTAGDRSSGGDTFNNCIFMDGTTLESSCCSLSFRECKFNYDELPSRPLVTTEGRAHLVIDDCKIRSARNERERACSRSNSRNRRSRSNSRERIVEQETTKIISRIKEEQPLTRGRSRGKEDRTNALFKLRGTNGDNRIQDTDFDVSNSSLSESLSEAHYIFDVGSSQPIYFQNNLVRLSSNHGRLFVFGSKRSIDSVSLSISNSTFMNRTPETPFVGIVSNLWARTQRTDMFGSISIDSSVGNSVFAYWYDDTTRRWPQNLSISNSTFTSTGTSTTETSSIVFIEQPPQSNWQLSVSNTNVTSRNVVPIVIESVSASSNPITSTGGENFTLTVTNTFFRNLELPSVGSIPWLRVTGLTNFTINIDAGSSIRGFSIPEYVSNGTISQNVNPALL